MAPGTRFRRIAYAVSGPVAWGAGLCWFLAFDYADWLRFSSPRAPDPHTGQVIYEKAVKGVFYITAAQAFWVQTALTPIWTLGAAAILLGNWAKREGPVSVTGRTRRIIGAVWFGLMMILFFFGDRAMALAFTGSLIIPPTPR